MLEETLDMSDDDSMEHESFEHDEDVQIDWDHSHQLMRVYLEQYHHMQNVCSIVQ